MASNKIVLASAQQPIKAELLSVLTTSDEQITNHIYATHVHADDNNFDEVSLFAIMENILKCATIVVDNVILIYIYIYIYICYHYMHILSYEMFEFTRGSIRIIVK